MSGKHRLLILDDSVADALTAHGYKMDGQSLLVDIEEIAEILDIIDCDEELDFEGDDE